MFFQKKLFELVLFMDGRLRNNYLFTVTTLISLMRYTGLIENLDSLIPDIPESPYNKTLIRCGNKI